MRTGGCSTRAADTGVLKLTLHPNSYEWKFIDTAGAEFDQGSQPTHNQGSPPTPDTEAPSVPTELAATVAGPNQLDLAWKASNDNVAVTGYKIYRDGSLLTSIPPSPTSYSDRGLLSTSTHTYRVTAVDAAGNESALSDPATATTAAGETVLKFAPTDDTYIRQRNAKATAGAATRLETDGSPVSDFLVKFNVTGTGACTLSRAMLRLTVGSTTDDNSDYGGDFRSTDTGWSESSVTWRTAPAVDPAVVAKLGPVALNSTYLVDISDLVKGDGPVAIRVSSPSSDGARYFSKEGSATQGPQLQVTCS